MSSKLPGGTQVVFLRILLGLNHYLCLLKAELSFKTPAQPGYVFGGSSATPCGCFGGELDFRCRNIAHGAVRTMPFFDA